MSVSILARLAPQRLTQYAALAAALAPSELAVSPLAPHLTAITPLELAGQPYLRLTPDGPLPPLPALATLDAFFELREELGGEEGPWLRPLPIAEPLRYPAELVEARRYRGKTNELFTAFLVNIARWSHPARPRWLLDPMAGGGTTLFTALRLALDVMGIERDRTMFEGTDRFLSDFLQEARLRHRRTLQRRRAGARVSFELPEGQRAHLALGETQQSVTLLADLPGAPRADLVVVDLPYAIQHRGGGSLDELLTESLPAWHAVAAPAAVLALGWNATTFPRDRMVDRVGASPWRPLDEPPYDGMAHRVDRVIRRRDVLVARRGDG